MAFIIGDPITADDYNNLAVKVNLVFAENNSSITTPIDSSDIITSLTPGAGLSLGAGPFPFSLLVGAPTTVDDFIVVEVNNEIKIPGYASATIPSFTIDHGLQTITFISPLAVDAPLTIYRKTLHRYGWGQSGAVVPINGGAQTLVYATDFNFLIDRMNIMLTRINSIEVITRAIAGSIIYADDLGITESTLATDIMNAAPVGGVGYYIDGLDSSAASINYNVITTNRTAPWKKQIDGSISYTFSSYSDARYFFNTGGSVLLSPAMVSTVGNETNAGYLTWQPVFNNIGTVHLFHGSTALDNATLYGLHEGKGFYHLTTEWQLMFTSLAPTGFEGGEYASVRVRIYAKYSMASAVSPYVLEMKFAVDDTSVLYDTAVDPLGLDVLADTSISGGYRVMSDITDNSASLHIDIPTIAITNTLTSPEDT